MRGSEELKLLITLKSEFLVHFEEYFINNEIFYCLVFEYYEVNSLLYSKNLYFVIIDIK